jgi:fermentation-respiration switch protein FrsA (DUF1100 family)
VIRRALASIVAAVVLFAGARAAGRAFVFPSWRVTPLPAPGDLVPHEVQAADGVQVRSLELAAPPGARTVVHFHNNRETAEHGAEMARALRARGVGVLLVEYRGYGTSNGSPSEEGLYRDAEAALAMLAGRGTGPDRVVLWGTSLGTGVAAEMARRGRGSRLVLVSPYTSIPDLVTGTVPFVPARALLADRFETLAKAREIHVPTLVIHGDADEIVPFAMGEQVARALGGELLRVEGGRHGDLFVRDGERLLDAIAATAKD